MPFKKLITQINRVYKYLRNIIPKLINKKNTNFHISESFNLVEKHRLKEIKNEIFNSKNLIAEEFLREFLEANSPVLFDVFEKYPTYMVRIFSIALSYDSKPIKQNKSTK